MSRTTSWKSRLAPVALLAGIMLAAPAAEARVGFGITVPLVVPPPVMAPPPVVVAPPPYCALPPGYYDAPPPAYGYFWYDRFGRRHWAH